MSQIIELNVGGSVYCTTINTLLSEKNSFFETLINKKTEQVKDSNNRYFIDRDGRLFNYVLDYLRNKLSFVPPDNLIETNRLKIEAEYYKLDGMVKFLSLKQISPLTHILFKKSFGCIVVGYRG
jgi:hypothetical protein